MKTILNTLLCTMMLIVPIAYAEQHQATLEFAERRELSVPVSGIVQTIDVKVGQLVEQGQLLIKLDPTLFQAAIEQAEAQLSRTRSERAEAQRDYRKTQELYDRATISQVALENAKYKSERAEAAYLDAKAQLVRAKYELEHSLIQAPAAGWILAVKVEPGASIVNNWSVQPLIVLAARDRYIARAHVTSETITQLAMGKSAQVIIGNQAYPAVIHALSYEPITSDSADALRYRVEVLFNTSGAIYLAGQPAQIDFEVP